MPKLSDVAVPALLATATGAAVAAVVGRDDLRLPEGARPAPGSTPEEADPGRKRPRRGRSSRPAGSRPAGRGGTGSRSGGGSGKRGSGRDRDGAQQGEGEGAGERGEQATKPTEIPAAGWKDIVKRAWAEQKDDNVGLMAAGCAYYAFLALFPALIAAVTIYGLVASPEDVTSYVEDLAQSSPAVAEILRDPLTSIASSSGGALGVGLVLGLGGALFSASGGMQNFMKAINIAYDEEDTRGFVKLRGTALMLTLGAILFFAVTIGLVAVLPAVLQVVDIIPGVSILLSIAPFVVLLLFATIALAVLYRFAPDRDDARVSWTSLGAGIATVIWLLATVGFFFYVRNFSSYSATYGALAGVIILLFFFYLTAFIFLMGAEINSEAEKQTQQDTTQGEEQPRGERGAVAADARAPSSDG